MKVDVSDTKILAQVLDKLSLDYEIESDTEASVFGSVKISDLAVGLANDGGELISIHEQDENLEGYFINLIGGGEDE